MGLLSGVALATAQEMLKEKKPVVLRINVEEAPGSLSFSLEGRLVGPWVDELQRLCQERGALAQGVTTTIDLCEVTAMDTRGQALLDELFHHGATLRCSDVMNQYLVEQMAGPAERKQETSRPCRGTSSGTDSPLCSKGGALASPGRDVTRLGAGSGESLQV